MPFLPEPGRKESPVRGEGDAPPGRPSSEDVTSRVAWKAVDRARPPGESGALPLRDSAGIGPDFADHHAPGIPGTEEDAGRSGRNSTREESPGEHSPGRHLRRSHRLDHGPLRDAPRADDDR